MSRLAFLGAKSPFALASVYIGKRFAAAVTRLAATMKGEGRGVLVAVLSSTSRRWMEDWMARCCQFKDTHSGRNDSIEREFNDSGTAMVENIEWTKQITSTIQVGHLAASALTTVSRGWWLRTNFKHTCVFYEPLFYNMLHISPAGYTCHLCRARKFLVGDTHLVATLVRYGCIPLRRHPHCSNRLPKRQVRMR